MRKLTMLLLLVSLAFGCGSSPVKGLTEAEPDRETIKNPYFADASADYVYRTKISVYGNELGGILIAKKLGDTLHRIALTTDFGNTLLDVSIGEKSFKVNSVVEELDRKILLKTLEEDFRLLLKTEFPVNSQFGQGAEKWYASAKNDETYWLQLSENGGLSTVVKGSGRSEKFRVLFQSKNNTFAEKITIRHSNLKLVLELNALK